MPGETINKKILKIIRENVKSSAKCFTEQIGLTATKLKNEKKENFINLHLSTKVPAEIVGRLSIINELTRQTEWVFKYPCCIGILEKDNIKKCKKKNGKSAINADKARNEYSKLLNNLGKQKELKSILMVLESPHVCEYCCAKTPHPAFGHTGQNIKKYLHNYINKFFPTECNASISKFDSSNQIIAGEYNLVIMNAISYQCSLGKSTDLYRDEVFKMFWNKGGQDLFEKDLKDAIEKYNVKVIINSSTKGKGKDFEIRNEVQKVINSVCKEKPILRLRSSHPSSWPMYGGLYSCDEWDKNK